MNPFADFKSEIKLFLIVAAVSAVLAVGGVLLLQAGLGPSSPAPQTPPPQPSATPAVPRDQAKLDFAGWQTYRNTEFGFELKYPEGWQVFESRSQLEVAALVRFSDPHSGEDKRRQINLNVSDSPTPTIEEYIDGFMGAGREGEYVSSVEDISIGGVLAKKVVLEGGDVASAEPYVGFLILENGKLYRWDGTDQGILTQILATFRFTP